MSAATALLLVGACTDWSTPCTADPPCAEAFGPSWVCGESGRCEPGPEDTGTGPAPSTTGNTSSTGDTGTGPIDPPPQIDPACSENGCLRSATLLGSYDRAALAPLVQLGVVLENGYHLYAIEYVTDGRTSTATVSFPLDPRDAPPAGGYPVVVNAHGSVGLDDPCQLTGTDSGAGLAGLFGARGAIGVAPDHPGLGTPGLQSYLDSDSEGASALDAIRAALDLAEIEGVEANGRAAVVGQSQGGHTALAAAARYRDYAPELDIRAFAASAPANVYEEQWRPAAAIPGYHLAVHAMLVYSFAEVAGFDDGEVWAPGLADLDGILSSRCLWSPSLATGPTLYDLLPLVPDQLFSPAFLAEYTAGEWQRFGFMHDGFERNRIRPFEQPAPIAIWQGQDDDVVLTYMTEALVDDLRSGGMNVELYLVPSGTHYDTAFGYLAYYERATDESVAWIKARLEE